MGNSRPTAPMDHPPPRDSPPATPALGEWEWEWGPADDEACVYSVRGEQTETIAFLYCAHPEGAAGMVRERERMLAYARLMASAPALLAALRALLEADRQGTVRSPTESAWAAAQAAVEQAGEVGPGGSTP